MTIAFEKYQGTGNDFVVIDNRAGMYSSLSTMQIEQICHRNFGVGSDGLMLLQNVKGADFEMVFFNPDGSKSLCGNGSRCAVVFAERLGLAKKEGEMITTDGVHAYRILAEGEIAIGMRDVGFPQMRSGHHFLHTGSPHLIVEVDDVDAIDVVQEGRKWRRHPQFESEGGTNVNFVSAMGGHSYGVRTYERGVENETLSCGTGVTAVALCLSHKYDVRGPLHIHTHGGVLQVSYEKDAHGFSQVWLQGPVKHVFSGTIDA